MNQECSIVRDLLPLYTENMVSPETAQYIEEIRLCVNQFGTVGSLEYLRRAGRVKASKAFFGNLFGVKPINNVRDNKIASMQYLVSNDPDDDACVATHVFIDATYAGTYQTFYLLHPISHDSETALYPWLSGYVVYEALIDGQKAYVAATDFSGTGFGNDVIGVENALYEAYMKVIDGTTINGLPLYLALDAVEPVDWVLVNGPVNGLISVNDVLSLIGHGHLQIADEAPIHVVYHMYINEQFEKDYTYKTFAGESRDADFEAFFSYNDFASMNIYVTTETVGDKAWGEVEEITEMWIELTEK